MPGCTTDMAEGFSPLLSGNLTTDLALLALVPLGSAEEHRREGEEGTGKGVKTAEGMAMAMAALNPLTPLDCHFAILIVAATTMTTMTTTPEDAISSGDSGE